MMAEKDHRFGADYTVTRCAMLGCEVVFVINSSAGCPVVGAHHRLQICRWDRTVVHMDSTFHSKLTTKWIPDSQTVHILQSHAGRIHFPGNR